MKTKIILLALLCIFTLNAQEKLTNQSIVDMIKLGFNEEVIISKIKNSPAEYNVSIEELKKLMDQGATSEIIATVVSVSGNTKTKEVKENYSGIYFTNDQNKKVKILPSVFSGTKTNTLAAGLTYGIASAKVKSVINNAESRNRTNKENLAFDFYFSPSSENSLSAQGGSDWWFKTATSPNEFVLVQLKVNERKNCRTLETGKVNVYSGSSVGIDTNDAIPFEIEQISETHFRVKSLNPLTPGEYCFFYQGTVPQGGYNNQSVFDFNVQ